MSPSPKKSAGLTAGLVAVKGAATPPVDAGVTRAAAAPPPPPLAPVAPAAATPVAKPAKAPAEPAGEPLNFRVTASFRREFRMMAADRNLKLNELLVLAFEAYKNQKSA